MTQEPLSRRLHHLYISAVQSRDVVTGSQREGKPTDVVGRLASQREWKRFKDTMLALLMTRNRGPASTGPTLADLGRRLARLQVPPESAGLAADLLYDHGSDLGRHILSKPILHDELGGALEHLAADVHQAGLGILSPEEMFHRAATLRLALPEGLGEAQAAQYSRFVCGLLHGALGEVFNGPAEVVADSGRIHVDLGDGADVNEEAIRDG